MTALNVAAFPALELHQRFSQVRFQENLLRWMLWLHAFAALRAVWRFP